MQLIRSYIVPVTIALTPVILTLVCISTLFNASPSDFNPVWNDEIDYWHQILTFVTSGFNGGYYSIEEKIAKATFTHFGTHGPFFAMLFGTVARLSGWNQSSGIFFNMICIVFGALFYLWNTRSSLSQSLLTGLLLFTCWPLLLYIPTTMQESLHHGLALTMAALFWKLYQEENRAHTTIIATFTILTIASLLRATWAILFIPLLFLVIPGKRAVSLFMTFMTGLFFLALFLYLFTLLAAPYPDNFVNTFLMLFKLNPANAMAFFLSHAATNIGNLFSLSRGYPLERLQHYQVVVVLAGSIATLIVGRRQNFFTHESFLHITNLAFISVLVILLYDTNDWMDYRVVAPHLLFSTAILLASRSYRLPLSLIISSIFFVTGFLGTYRLFHKEHFAASPALGRVFALYAPYLRYQATASPWANSLLTDMENVQPFIMGLPGGIGINAVRDWKRLAYPIRSSYILAPPALIQSGMLRGNVTPLVAGPFGTLYKNLDAPLLQGQKP